MPDQLTPSLPDRQKHISGDPKRVEEQQSESDVEIACNFELGSPLVDSDDMRIRGDVNGANFTDE